MGRSGYIEWESSNIVQQKKERQYVTMATRFNSNLATLVFPHFIPQRIFKITSVLYEEMLNIITTRDVHLKRAQ